MSFTTQKIYIPPLEHEVIGKLNNCTYFYQISEIHVEQGDTIHEQNQIIGEFKIFANFGTNSLYEEVWKQKLVSQRCGIVKSVLVKPNTQVTAFDALIEIEYCPHGNYNGLNGFCGQCFENEQRNKNNCGFSFNFEFNANVNIFASSSSSSSNHQNNENGETKNGNDVQHLRLKQNNDNHFKQTISYFDSLDETIANKENIPQNMANNNNNINNNNDCFYTLKANYKQEILNENMKQSKADNNTSVNEINSVADKTTNNKNNNNNKKR